MKEDILEQLIEDWFVARNGWFVKHNIKFRPHKEHKDYISKKDSVHSDIDILAFSHNEKGCKRVVSVTCKSWQSGFNLKEWKESIELDVELNSSKVDFKPREKWKYFRELISDKWLEAFVKKIEQETGQRDFTYMIAVTKINGTNEHKISFESSEVIKKRFKKYNSKIEIQIKTLREILHDYSERIYDKETPSLESTDVGRFLQLIHAAKIKLGD
jgi:PIN domain nuclease of toxin-antitoxin system